MKTLVAVDPIESKGKTFERFCKAVKHFQEKGIISQATIASTIHASLYLIPNQWYRDMKGRFAKEAQDRIKAACKDRFEFESAKVLQSDSHSNEDLVAQLSRFGQRKGSDLLVVGSSNRAGLPHWILGSFAETAALTSVLPVMVIKPHWQDSTYAREVRFLVAVDVAVPPSAKQVRWISKAAKASNAGIDLVYVEPKHRLALASIRVPKNSKNKAANVLKNLQLKFSDEGISSETHIVEESKSLAHALADFADRRRAWLIILTSAKRSLPHRLLLGSTARRLLALTERPFLSLRLGRSES